MPAIVVDVFVGLCVVFAICWVLTAIVLALVLAGWLEY